MSMLSSPKSAIPQVTTKFGSFETHDIASGGYVTLSIDTDIKPNQLSGGQNVDINGSSPEKRKGHTVYGSVSGFTTGILDLISHDPSGGTSEILRVYDTVLERYVAGTWAALTSVTMTSGLPADHAYFPPTKKTYVGNGTDNVVKYASGAAGDQTDATFKKGKYMCYYNKRLIVAGVTGFEEFYYFTDDSTETFTSGNSAFVEGTITGLKVLGDKLMILTKDRIYIVNGFTNNGSAIVPVAQSPLKSGIGCVAHRTWQTVGSIAYFLGLSSEGISMVQATDGLTISNNPISLPIYTDFNSLAPAQLTNACAGAWGRYYRLSVTPTGQTTNTEEFLYDTVGGHWQPPYTNGVGGFSCYTNYTTGGQKFLFAGNQTNGSTYQLNQVNYDELLTASFTTAPDTDGPVDASPAKRAAQGFKIPVMQSSTYLLTGVMLYLKKNTGTTTELTVRIETDSAGVPSGTLADANLTTTIPAFTSTSYAWYFPKFTTPAALSTTTQYWIVLKHTTEGSGTSQYYWGYKATGTYASGTGASYASAAWTAQSAADYLFGAFIEGDYDAYADTAALYIGPIGQKFHLRDLFSEAKASGNYNIQVGVSVGDYSSFDYQDMSISSGAGAIGSTFTIGTSQLGGQLRSEKRLRWDAIRGYTLKLRFRNRFANQPFKIYGFRTRHEVLPKVK